MNVNSYMTACIAFNNRKVIKNGQKFSIKLEAFFYILN